uniref:Uncharacterized protein n=1 Tax=Arion vulgaris TaxID=1028688 RepID=A0A0B6YXY7_9EUPU
MDGLQRKNSIRRSHIKILSWVYRSGHAGAQDNEHTDWLANNALFKQAEAGTADVINAAHIQLRNMDQSQTHGMIVRIGD